MSIPLIARAVVETAKVSVPTIFESAFGTLSTDVCDTRLDSWSRRLLEQAGVTLALRGEQNAPVGESFVVMSNHQSHYDIPAVFQALKRRVRMVTKKELFRVPVWGRAMRVAGFVEIDRSNREQAVQALDGARQAILDGTSIWIAPEGTRSDSGRLGPFKKGGFHMALGSGARILPVSIDGTRDVLPARDWRIRPGAVVRVTFGPPLSPLDYGAERMNELMADVRAAIERPLPEY